MAPILELKSKTLYIFDFDDTLAETHSRVWVNNPTKGKFPLTPAEYAVYNPAPDDSFDYGEFEQLINPVQLPKYVQRLKSAIKQGAPVSIVTARGSSTPVAQFLKQIGVTRGVKIAAVGSSDPAKKTDYIEKKIKSGVGNVVMYDDSPKNIQAFQGLAKKYPNIYFHGHEVPKKAEPDTTSSAVRQGLNATIKNPETNNDILVKTALGYDKNHPARKTAIKYLHQQRKSK
jgi:hydroxymethylpyrimidine pyrophosphatase-like HAD family hydrolase